jgi:hypothetical protein
MAFVTPNSITFTPGAEFACVMTTGREPGPEMFVVVTVKVAARRQVTVADIRRITQRRCFPFMVLASDPSAEPCTTA